MSQDIGRELARLRRLPYGTARTSATEALARQIDAEGPKNKLPEALLDLVEVYCFSDDSSRAFSAFAWVLRVWDASPELFDEADRRNLFWEYKWVANTLAAFPQITKQQAETFLAEMAQRYQLEGLAMTAVEALRFQWTWHSGVGDPEEPLAAWQRLSRDEMSDCAGCDIGMRVDYLTEVGRYAEALELAAKQKFSCNVEPRRTLHAEALAALLTGDADRAARAHRRGNAIEHDDDSHRGAQEGQAFELLARGGQLAAALRRLRYDDAAMLEKAPSPLQRLRFLLGVLAGLSANLDQPDTETGFAEPEWATVAALHAWVQQAATELAQVFDERGETSYYADLLSQALRVERAEVTLDLTVPSLPAAAPRLVAATEKVAAAATDGASLLAAADALLQAKQYNAAASSYRVAAEAFEAEGRLSAAGLAHADAGQCSLLASDEEAAHSCFKLAWPLLRAGETSPEVVAPVIAAWAPVAVRFDDLTVMDAAEQAVSAADDIDTKELSAEVAEERRRARIAARASLRDTLARCRAELLPGEKDAAATGKLAIVAAEEYAGIGMIADAAHAFWVAGKVMLRSTDPQEGLWALESAYEGFTVAKQAKWRAEAAGDFIDALRAAGHHGQADEVAAQLAE